MTFVSDSELEAAGIGHVTTVIYEHQVVFFTIPFQGKTAELYLC